jgi:hypothetical protein
MPPFVVEQRPLGGKTTAVAPEIAVAAEHAVTGDDDR